VNHPLDQHPQLAITFRNGHKKVYNFDRLQVLNEVVKYINFLETSTDRKNYWQRHKHVWWRYEQQAEIKDVQVMVDARETDEGKEEIA
jgi:hypothetical protein